MTEGWGGGGVGVGGGGGGGGGVGGVLQKKVFDHVTFIKVKGQI